MHPGLAASLFFFLGSFVQGLTGFGQALVAMPLLVMVLDVKVAVPLSMLNGLLITGYLSYELRGHADWRKVLPLLLGCLPGIPVGIYLLKEINEDFFKISLGLILIGYGLYALILRPRMRPATKGIKPLWAYIAGFGTGAISAAFSAGGPPTIIYSTLTGWTKDQIKATLSIFFFLAGIVTALAHLAGGLTTTEVLGYLPWTLPAVLTGVFCGSRLYQRFKTDTYLRLVLIALIGMGMMMLSGGLRH